MNPDLLLALIAHLAADDLLSVSEQHVARVAQPREPSRRGTVAVIPVLGPLMGRSASSWFGRIEGMDVLRQRIDAAAANADVSAIVLDIDSPGGSVAGTAETADSVARAAAIKPVIAVANSLAASAAYWIAAQASEVVMTPAALTGSVGVMQIHQNLGKAMERVGVEMTMITSGARKAEANPFGPLSDVAKAAMQARVDEAAQAFYGAVASGRKLSLKVVKERAGDGQVFTSSEAVTAGLADRIATLDQVIADLSTGKAKAFRRRSALAFA